MTTTLYTDREIVAAILRRDVAITTDYLYRTCRPLFESCYRRYYTDCENYIEFINEIYLYIMLPTEKTGSSKLSTFDFRCTLTNWLKILAENYCKQLFKKRQFTGLLVKIVHENRALFVYWSKIVHKRGHVPSFIISI